MAVRVSCASATTGNTCTGITGSGARRGVWGTGRLDGGTGVQGDAMGKDGIGVQGTVSQDGGSGVEGRVLSVTSHSTGVHGSSTLGWGVFGESDSNTGVLGNSTSAPGVAGFSWHGIGVLGTTNGGSSSYGGAFTSTLGTGVKGASTHGTGVRADSDDNIALYAKSNSGLGAFAFSTSYYGILGWSAQSRGIVGAGGTIGVQGTTTSVDPASYGGVFSATLGTGVYGESDSGNAVWGISKSLYGVHGVSASNYGVLGSSTTSAGVRGISTSLYGVYASSTDGIGLHTQTTNGLAALRAKNVNPGTGNYSIIAEGNVTITGTLHATGGIVAPVATSQGMRETYADQSTTHIMSDQGTATLKDGWAVIPIDPLYAQMVSLAAGYQVFVTPWSAETVGLAVINRTATSFEVRELGKGSSSFHFDWRISAPRKGYEKVRMAPAPVVPAAPAGADESAALLASPVLPPRPSLPDSPAPNK